jgi:uncharacterized protein
MSLRREADFTSLRYPFAIDTAQGEVTQERRFEAHVEQLVRQVLLTSPGERINRPDFGCGVKRLVFAPGGAIAASLAQSVVYQSLDKWLGNVIVVNTVTVRAVEERLDIEIVYVIRARSGRHYLNLSVAP